MSKQRFLSYFQNQSFKLWHRFIYNTAYSNTIKCKTLEIKKIETINTGFRFSNLYSWSKKISNRLKQG